MIKIQGKEIQNVASRAVTIVRTYKGEIERTQTGNVAGYPISYRTVGVTLNIIDDKPKIREIQQIILSADTVKLQADLNGVDFYGDFSVTNHAVEDIRNKGETKSSLTIDFVNDNTKITKPDGTQFKVSYGSSSASAYFAQLLKNNSFANYTLDGMTIPNNTLLVLGDSTLTAKS